MTLPNDAEQSTKRQGQEEVPRESQLASSSSCAAADTSVHIPDSQIPKPARQVSLAKREDSQRPAEVNAVLTGVYSGNETATLTDDQKALDIARLN